VFDVVTEIVRDFSQLVLSVAPVICVGSELEVCFVVEVVEVSTAGAVGWTAVEREVVEENGASWEGTAVSSQDVLRETVGWLAVGLTTVLDGRRVEDEAITVMWCGVSSSEQEVVVPVAVRAESSVSPAFNLSSERRSPKVLVGEGGILVEDQWPALQSSVDVVVEESDGLPEDEETVAVGSTARAARVDAQHPAP
jgi:hypothetical protein